jgi:hypothetical protein
MIEKKPSHSWTKDEIRSVAKLWETVTSRELCDRISINYQQLLYIAREMRKVGFVLPKKSKIGYVRNLLLEVKEEMK